jgi:hypothetical protein
MRCCAEVSVVSARKPGRVIWQSETLEMGSSKDESGCSDFKKPVRAITIVESFYIGVYEDADGTIRAGRHASLELAIRS